MIKLFNTAPNTDMNILIKTERNFQHWPSFDLIYEWEDIFLEQLKTQFYTPPHLCIHGKNILPKIYPYFPIDLEKRKLHANYCFTFEMLAKKTKRPINNSKTIVCIVDFYLKKEELPDFYKTYKPNPYLFVSSAEVYDFIIKNQPERQLYHLPLSISDKYKLSPDTKFEKKYDLVLMGRQNKLLMSYLEIYKKTHPINYVYRNPQKGKFLYYSSNGEFVGEINTRETYMKLMQQAKAGFYTTAGIDEDEFRTNGFSQVTPRFLELIACGCNIVSRYKENPDTDYFELNKFASSVQSYQAFESALENAITNPPDMKEYASYLEKHYTSKRVEILKRHLAL